MPLLIAQVASKLLIYSRLLSQHIRLGWPRLRSRSLNSLTIRERDTITRGSQVETAMVQWFWSRSRKC